ncbi:MAG TPA: peptide-methionine (S)-S-oxide reductase MsrA [Usitatibacter sp.]|nr:peptide-methionine (S)-S-oxide reductase MsrA [Usitatibacter sp.]
MKKPEIATLAGGCFWCLEAVFDSLKGVESVESGYMGGAGKPTYEEVCTGTTGHAEVVRVAFDPDVVSYGDLLEVFFAIHDPTTRDRQGNDVGSQYRSAIFFHSPEQERVARETVERLGRETFSRPIVTEIAPASAFHEAEAYHQEYYRRVGARNPYCTFVIDPKVLKLRRKFAARLKDGS